MCTATLDSKTNDAGVCAAQSAANKSQAAKLRGKRVPSNNIP